MALTRKFLKAMGIEDEKIDEIITAHSETVSALKEERDQYKEDAEKLPDVQKQLEKANADLKAADSDGYKAKYEAEKAAHEKLKADTETAKTRAAKESALRETLKAAGFSDSGIAKIVKYSGLTDTVELDEDGKPKNGDAILKTAGEEWGEYKGKAEPAAANVANPPASASEGSKKSNAADIVAQIQREFYGEQPNESKKEG